MKEVRIIALLSLVAFLLLSSGCGKENVDTIEEEQEVFDPQIVTVANGLIARTRSAESGEGLDLDCIEILFPFSLVDEEGQGYEIIDQDALSAIIDSTSAVAIVDFQYPLNIVNSDGDQIAVANGLELGELFATCIPNGGWSEDFFPAYLINSETSCYSLVYPLALMSDDGISVQVNSEKEFIDQIAKAPLTFVFPFVLSNGGGETVTVGSTDELFETLFSCNGLEIDSFGFDWEQGFENFGCYKLSFPFNVLNANGESITVNNHQELCDLLLIGELSDYAYPITLIDDEGEEEVANSREELEALLSSCYLEVVRDWNDLILISIFINIQYGGCFAITYPFPVTVLDDNGDSTIININSFEELSTGFESIPQLHYPLLGTSYLDGSPITIANAQELYNLRRECQAEPLVINDFFFLLSGAAPDESSEAACYTINYPITLNVTGPDGVVQEKTFASFEEVEFRDPVSLFYPVTVSLRSDESEVILNNREDIETLLMNCFN